MSANFECEICHTLQEKPEGLCHPVTIQDQCQRPTDLGKNLAVACDEVLAEASLYCEGCGRPTTQPWSICMPMLINRERPFG